MAVYRMVRTSARREAQVRGEEEAYLAIVWQELLRQATKCHANMDAASKSAADIREAVSWGTHEWAGDLKYARAVVSRERKRLDIIEDQKGSAYFGRVDVLHPETKVPREYRIGRHSLSRDDHRELLVCDWRAEIASLYYQPGQKGHDVRLRRSIDIEGDRIKAIHDREAYGAMAGGDPFLASLSRAAQIRMRQVIRSIQEEQYRIITAPVGKHIYLDGCAGSGKTVVTFHRAAYLCYNRDISPHQILFVVPGKAFHDYVSSLPRDLDIEGVLIADWTDLARAVLMDRHLVVSPQDGSDLTALLRSRRMTMVLTAYVERLVSDVIERLAADPFIRLRDDTPVRPFPLDISRVRELLMKTYAKLPLNERLDRSVDQVTSDYATYLVKYGDLHRPKEQDMRFLRGGVARRFAGLRIMDTVAAYRALYGPGGAMKDCGGGGVTGAEVATAAARNLRTLTRDDVAPLIYLHWLINGLSSVLGAPSSAKYIVCDEAQEVSPMEILILDRLASRNGGSVMLVGDRYQALSGRWGGVPDHYASYDSSINYRARSEIVDLAAMLSGRLMTSIPRVNDAGAGPALIWLGEYQTGSALADNLGSLLERLDGDGKTLAVITGDATEACWYHERLASYLDGLELIASGTDRYVGGHVVIPVDLAGGLEFDTVIVPDVSVYSSSDDPGDGRRRLYVAVSRAVNRLVMGTTGAVPFGLDTARFEPVGALL